MKKRHSKLKRRRAALFHQQGGKCHWCKCEMLMPDVYPRKDLPPNLCTVDHLRDRWHPQRRERNPHHEQRWVAACLKCNNERGRAETQKQTIEEIWRRSGHYQRMVESRGSGNEPTP